ncbi:hypothetical protein IJT93_00930 [bacterium]|nr:hypothetical protein [bacterium]
MLIKVIIIMLIGVFVNAFANLFVAQGMRRVDTSIAKFTDIFRIIGSVLTNGRVVGGGILMILSFIIWLSVLSMADLSFILPLTALDYIVNAFLAKLYLKEHVSAMRWTGTFIIFIGVLTIILGETV